jgi:hypothetical protein
MACFEHVLGRYVKETGDERVIRACLIAWGTNMGLGRRGEISDIPYPTLAQAAENFLGLETLHAANDCVSNAIAALPTFRYYDLGDVIHSSSDGHLKLALILGATFLFKPPQPEASFVRRAAPAAGTAHPSVRAYMASRCRATTSAYS